MSRPIPVICLLALLPLAARAAEPAAGASLSAAQIVERNIAARGGLNAWRSVKTLTWSGKMAAGGNRRPTLPMADPQSKASPLPARPAEEMQLPFVMQLKRPRKSRLEIVFNGQSAIQVYDGAQGWKLRPFLNRHQVEQFTTDELKAAATQGELDGPLLDYASKGTAIALEGTEVIEGHNTYRLKLTLKSRQVQHVWIDANSFLETKIEGTPRRLDGRMHPVWVFMREYKSVSGVMMPTVLETTVQGVAQTEKISIDKIDVNQSLPDSRFAKPS